MSNGRSGVRCYENFGALLMGQDDVTTMVQRGDIVNGPDLKLWLVVWNALSSDYRLMPIDGYGNLEPVTYGSLKNGLLPPEDWRIVGHMSKIQVK